MRKKVERLLWIGRIDKEGVDATTLQNLRLVGERFGCDRRDIHGTAVCLNEGGLHSLQESGIFRVAAPGGKQSNL